MNATGGAGRPPVLFGSLALPIPVFVEQDALGVTVDGRIGAARVRVRVPYRQEPDPELDTDDLALTMGVQRGDSPLPTTGQVLRDWEEVPPADANEGPIRMRRLLLSVQGAEPDLGAPRRGIGSTLADRLCDEVLRFGNRWHDVFRSWVEVLTLQDLDHFHPRWTAHVEGSGIATFNVDGSRFGSGGVIRLDSEWPTPATAGEIETALRGAGEDHYPPLAHLLLRDARAAWYRDQTRRALIDAATATEVSLSADAKKAGLLSSGKFLMLGQLVKKLHATGRLSPEEADELSAVVVRPRNKAIHEGAVPSSWDVAEACKVAQRRVEGSFPL